MARANAFWPTTVAGEADSVRCYVSHGQKALLHGTPSEMALKTELNKGVRLCLLNLQKLLTFPDQDMPTCRWFFE